MTKRNDHLRDWRRVNAPAARLPEPTDDPAAAGFAAAKRDNLLAASAEIFIPTSGLTSAAIEELVTEMQNATISERTGLSDIEIADSPEGLAIKCSREQAQRLAKIPAAAKADNLIQGRVRDRRAAEDRGEALAKKIHENCHDQLTPSEQADLLAYLRCGR